MRMTMILRIIIRRIMTLRKRYIFPEERPKIIDEVRLI